MNSAVGLILGTCPPCSIKKHFLSCHTYVIWLCTRAQVVQHTGRTTVNWNGQSAPVVSMLIVRSSTNTHFVDNVPSRSNTSVPPAQKLLCSYHCCLDCKKKIAWDGSGDLGKPWDQVPASLAQWYQTWPAQPLPHPALTMGKARENPPLV